MAVTRVSEGSPLEQLGVPPPPLPSDDGRCDVYMSHKKRYCRGWALPGSTKCGTHRSERLMPDKETTVEAEKRGEADLGLRIPCPLDPNHTVFTKKLQQHMLVCSKARDVDIVERQPFFKRSVNVRDRVEMSPAPVTADHLRDSERTAISAQVLSESLVEIAARIKAAYVQAVAEHRATCSNKNEEVDEVAAENLLRQSMTEAESTEVLQHSTKHGTQVQALAGLIKAQGLADDAIVVEYGCGQGGLAVGVLAAMPEARCVLVDREARKRKLEKQFRGSPDEERILRIRLDIANFDLAALLEEPDREALPKASDLQSLALSGFRKKGSVSAGSPAERLEALWLAAAELRGPPWPPARVLACAKHLCGGATDIALRSLQIGHGKTMPAVCIATCCHHLCDAATYVNIPFLVRLGLVSSSADMPALCQFASWAVDGTQSAGKGLDCELGMMGKRRMGLMVKRILDIGRVEWLKAEMGLANATLVHYINPEVTPENVAIIAGGSQSGMA